MLQNQEEEKIGHLRNFCGNSKNKKFKGYNLINGAKL
jgi:hypothetical protein